MDSDKEAIRLQTNFFIASFVSIALQGKGGHQMPTSPLTKINWKDASND